MRRTVAAAGGSITVSSGQGRGTEFIVTLPLEPQLETNRKGENS